MYFSQTAIVLVLLVFLTSTIFYQTVEFKANDVKNSMEIKKMSLYEKNLENTLDRVIDKIVEDAFVNRSYEIMHGNRNFYSSADEAVEDITAYIRDETNKSLCVLSNENNTISYSIESINISPVSNRGNVSPFYVKVHYVISLNYSKKLKNGYVVALKEIDVEKEVKLSRIPDPYVYRNNFYWTWNNERSISFGGTFPTNDNTKNYTFCIILNSSNFDYTHMNNSNSPREIRIIGRENGNDNDLILLPYWVQTWKQGTNNISIIWVRCNYDNLIGGDHIKLLYNSTTKVDKQNPDETFELFDDFNYMDYNKWNVSGGWYINNSILTVQGLGSSVYTNKTYGTGWELVFKGNFTPVHAQSVGFFKLKSDTDGVGWDCYDTTIWGWGDGAEIYMRNGSGSSGEYVFNGDNYLNKFYIYDLERISKQKLNFTILTDTLDIEYNYTYNNGDKDKKYPISINAINQSDSKVSIDWIFLKDINNITTTVDDGENLNPNYTELKPKTYKQTIYYGDPEQYVYVDDTGAGNYSIIGLLTNATDSWGNCGYRPKIEIE